MINRKDLNSPKVKWIVGLEQGSQGLMPQKWA